MKTYEIDKLLQRGCNEYPDHPYIFERHGDAFVPRTFAEFTSDVYAAAAALLEKGLEGQNIILYAANSYAYMVTDIAVMGYVGVSCTISKEWKTPDIIRSAEILHAAAVIYDEQREEAVSSLRSKHPEILYFRIDGMLHLPEPAIPLIPRSTEAVSKIIFSSGTTGNPKPVMLSQHAMLAGWDDLHQRCPFTIDDRDYLFLPLTHTYSGVCNFLYSLCNGMQIYLCSDTKKISEELQMVHPTMFCAVPLIYERIYESCKAGNISPADALGGSIRCLFSGGAVFRPELRQFYKNAGLNMLESYGLTETSSIISVEYSDPDDFVSVGTVLESIEIKIDNPDETGTGEILVRGENLFSGYYANPEATAAVFDADGFFRTGDLGSLNGKKLYLKGRKRRMILLSNGENIYPDELEAKYAEYPQLSKVKVYADNGQICAVLYASAPCDGDRITEEVNEKLPSYAKIRKTEVIPDSIDTRWK